MGAFGGNPDLAGEEGEFGELGEVEGDAGARRALPVALQHGRLGVELPVAVAGDLAQQGHGFL